jgi:hypothetical protein
MAGLAPKHVRRLARRFGLDLGEMTTVDPVQVEARAAGVTGQADSTQSLKAALRDVRRNVRELDRAYKKLAA